VQTRAKELMVSKETLANTQGGRSYGQRNYPVGRGSADKITRSVMQREAEMYAAPLLQEAANNTPNATSGDRALRELDGIAEVQRLLLPSSLPSIPGYDLAVAYEPLECAGGDHYDFLPLSGGCWGLLIADVNGHGARAAVGMAILHATVRAAPGCRSPARLLGWVSRQLAAGYASGDGNFITALYAILDPTCGVITYASAGHHPPLLWSAGNWRPLDGARHTPLGILPERDFTEARACLESGDALALYTDGIIEARNARGQMFGARGLARVHRRRCDSATETARLMQVAAQEFAGGCDARDDRTLVVMTANL
jgi:sigma-B regulation protein RsbU (phosphoserine phosphatase)